MAAEDLERQQTPQSDVEKQQDSIDSSPNKGDDDKIEYPGPKQLTGIMVALFLAIFLGALVCLRVNERIDRPAD